MCIGGRWSKKSQASAKQPVAADRPPGPSTPVSHSGEKANKTAAPDASSTPIEIIQTPPEPSSLPGSSYNLESEQTRLDKLIRELNKDTPNTTQLAKKIVQQHKVEGLSREQFDEQNRDEKGGDISYRVLLDGVRKKGDDLKHADEQKPSTTTDDTLYERHTVPAEKKKQKTFGKYIKFGRSKNTAKAAPHNRATPQKALNDGGFGEDIDFDPVTDKNFMYNLREINYCSHDIIRHVEKSSLLDTVEETDRMALPVSQLNPYADLKILEKRKYTTCKVLRVNTLVSSMMSMPMDTEKEEENARTAHSNSEKYIKFHAVKELCHVVHEDHREVTCASDDEAVPDSPKTMRSALERQGS